MKEYQEILDDLGYKKNCWPYKYGVIHHVGLSEPTLQIYYSEDEAIDSLESGEQVVELPDPKAMEKYYLQLALNDEIKKQADILYKEELWNEYGGLLSRDQFDGIYEGAEKFEGNFLRNFNIKTQVEFGTNIAREFCGKNNG